MHCYSIEFWQTQYIPTSFDLAGEPETKKAVILPGCMNVVVHEQSERAYAMAKQYVQIMIGHTENFSFVENKDAWKLGWRIEAILPTPITRL